MTWKTFVFLIATVCYAKNRLQIKPVPVSDTGLPVKVKSIQYVLFGPNPQLFDQLIELTFLSINPKPVATLSYYDYLQHKAEKTINLELIESQRTPYTYEYIENFKNYDHFVLDIAGSIPFEFVAVTSCGITPYDSVRPAIIDAWSKEYYVPGGRWGLAVLLLTYMSQVRVTELLTYGVKSQPMESHMISAGIHNLTHTLTRFVPKDVTLMNRKHLGHPIISYHFTSNDYFSVMMLGVDKQKKYMAEFVSTHVNGKMYDVVRLLSATTIQDYVFISTVDNNTLVVEKHEEPVQEQVTLSKGDLYHLNYTQFSQVTGSGVLYAFLYISDLYLVAQLVAISGYENAYILLFPSLKIPVTNYVFHVLTREGILNETLDGSRFTPLLRSEATTGNRCAEVFQVPESYIFAESSQPMGYYFYAINTKNNTQMIYHYPGRPPFNVYGGKLPTGYKPPNEPKDRMTTASTSDRSAPQNAWTLGQGSALIDQHELLCPVYYYGEQCSEVCTCAGNKCRTDGSCYTTECHRGSLGDGCTRTDLVMTGGIFSHKVLIDSDSSTGVGLAGNTLTLVLNDPGLSRSFTLELAEDAKITPEQIEIQIWNPGREVYEPLNQPITVESKTIKCHVVWWEKPVIINQLQVKVDSIQQATSFLMDGGENLRGGAAVGDAGGVARGNETSGPSAVYTLGVAPDNDPQLAAQLRDGNRFNTCIKADDQAEAGIEFQDEYTLYNMLISTTGTPLVVVVTCTNSQHEVLAKQKVRYKKGSRFVHLNINKKVKRCKIQSDNGPLELCEIDVFGDAHMMVNAEDIELSTSDDDATAASTFALVSSLVLLFLCLLLNVVALLKTHTKSTQDLALTSE